MSHVLVVVGLGYVGLPLARRACQVGMRVVGLDTDPAVIATLRAGRSHIGDVDDDDLGAMLAAGFTASADPAVLADAETVVICVPTGLTDAGEPDLGPLRSATATVADRLRPGMLVVVESTSFPGSTEELVLPILAHTGLVVGSDFYLGYSPERVDPGNPTYGLVGTPKVVSGCTALCTKRCQVFYEALVDTVVTAAGTREAELAKLLENTYRDVNIALVNQFAVLCRRLEVDVWDVLRCAASKPFGFQSFRPGPGVGGHCIPVDPRYLLHRARAAGVDLPLVDAARAVNAAMPAHVVAMAGDLLAAAGTDLATARVLLLGVTYKPDVADVRQSPAAPLVRLLRAAGARVSYHDPLIDSYTVDATVVPRRPEVSAARDADLTILLQEHRGYDLVKLSGQARLLLDTRGRVPAHPRVTRL